ncbi:hypothetical protein [Cronobacter turicensis]|uniref:hypothetical protein n=1 Tax=Cronobacter turicensis TaxID=413502 RepID=UPI0024C42E65|nr:hypothetical protein [Cronobacter turicensis]EMC4315864.1 hypothetical protein [Cronobacter sakazakii]MDK1227508.1 hypothetical protein [Cronobacter turicensis]
MSTISNERLEEITNDKMINQGSEFAQMARELLTLRKEREKAEPVATLYKAGNSAKVIMIGADLTDGYTDVFAELQPAPPAPTDTTAQQFESLAGKAVVPDGWRLVPVELTKEMRGKIHPFAEATCLDCGRQVVADCVDNVTASWNDMLAVAPEPCK